MFNQAMALNQYQINMVKHYTKQAFLFLLLLLPLLGQEAFAAAGLTAAKTGLTNFLAEIQPIVRVVAVIGIVGGGLGCCCASSFLRCGRIQSSWPCSF